MALPTQILQAKGLLPHRFIVPPLAQSRREGNDLFFDLNIQAGLSRFFSNATTKTWGINMPFLGETLRANKGDRVHINVKNSLPETTTLHWHGMKLPAREDGGPHQPVAPNATWLSEFDIIQPAATTWYHSHQLHRTGSQVYKGLAGLFIIDDKEADALHLPSEYGVDDFPVVIQDRTFQRDGSFSYVRSMRDRVMGKTGNVILVNGVVKPTLTTNKPLIRLRILNGSNSRIYQLAFDDKRSFHIIGSDGGLLEKPLKSNSVQLAPGERAEVLVDISDGGVPTLINQPNQNSRRLEPSGMMQMMAAPDKRFSIFQIDARGVDKIQATIPDNLVVHQKTDMQVSQKRHLKLQAQMGPAMMSGRGLSINGKRMDMNRIDEIVKAGSLEVWTVTNSSMMPHPLHIHNAQFKIIGKQGRILEHETGFKDTVLLEPRGSMQLLIHFPDYKDEKRPYMYHCHNLEHEDQGMMGQFLVV